jgi:hypothetical protein
VIQQGEVKDVREIGFGPAREPRQLNRQQSVPKRALRRYVMREVGGERDGREQLSETKAPFSVARVRS